MRKILSAFVGIMMCGVATAATDATLVSAAEKYLNSITGLQGTFVQTANGNQERGTFAMLRPGRVRLDYDNMPVQLIPEGGVCFFFARHGDMIITVPLPATPPVFLFRKNIDWRNEDIKFFDPADIDNTFSLKMNLRGQEGIGNMTVVFDKNPVKLNSWTVIDATGAKTDVAFYDLRTKTDFPSDYFQIQRHKTVSTSGGDSFYD